MGDVGTGPRVRAGAVALLLFASGACSLVYQTVWLREFRLVFGASTASTAAVLAIFMGGLGAGGIVFGGRADRARRPLALYGALEALIALAAAASPLLLRLVADAYVTTRSALPNATGTATLLRVALAAAVLLVPTILMGGTLPAAVRAVHTGRDRNRRALALLYGANTLGAVAGTLLSTFLLIERLGNLRALLAAAGVNAAVAGVALLMARRAVGRDGTGAVAGPRARGAMPSASPLPAPVAPRFVLAAAAAVGMAFLLLEIVWYRMLGPILGGSTFTFGLILAVALFGLGIGGLAFLLRPGDRPVTLRAFALSCALEALFVGLPLALGDRIAVLALLLRPLGSLGLSGFALGWTAVTALVVFPAAAVAGFQFPLLVALLGRGRDRVARHVGLAYAWNTAGAIAGSLAGGFGLLPVLTAPGTWRAVVALLVAVSLAALAAEARAVGRRVRPAAPLAACCVAAATLLPAGPTAAWRHGGIGAGRADLHGASVNDVRAWEATQRRSLAWEAEGVESSVGLMGADGLAFYVNGKSDGSFVGDAGTQVMSGLVGAALHPRPRRAFVVGLGTGSTAGWLARVPEMERVDVAEFEPAILEVARAAAPVNGGALDNPKLHVRIGDGREVLLTTPDRFDLIVSEPSNPYRAGIASLFTSDFYRAARARLGDGGLFLQWFQAYEVDAGTVQTAYATITSVFPNVDTWSTQSGDLLFVASAAPVQCDVPALRAKLDGEPYRTAMAGAWHATGLEAFLARFVARGTFATALGGRPGAALNTDDRTVMEFAFGRCLGGCGSFTLRELERWARDRDEHRPLTAGGEVDWEKVDRLRVSSTVEDEPNAPRQPFLTPEQVGRAEAHTAYANGDLARALAAWRSQPRDPEDLRELALLAECLAESGDASAAEYAGRLRQDRPAEADAVLARLWYRQGRPDEATAALVSAFERYREDPWPDGRLMYRGLQLAVALARDDPAGGRARRLLAAVLEPFAVRSLDGNRMWGALQIAEALDPNWTGAYVREAIEPFEPHVPWELHFLERRYDAYRQTGHPLARVARLDLDEFLENEGGAVESQIAPSAP